MSEKLKGMVDKNIFARIAIAAVDQKKQDQDGMQQLTALYLAMGWIKADEAAEILGYAQQQNEPPKEEVPEVSPIEEGVPEELALTK